VVLFHDSSIRKKDYLKYKDFHGTVHFSNEGAVFFGKIAGINDLITFEGASVKELPASFKEAVEDYISIRGREFLKA
jgi:predicted HicB family RNase H-like nuclease